MRRRAWKVTLVVFLVFLASVVFLAGRTGVVPGLSGLVGADEPRNLGVTVAQADYERVVQDLGTFFKKAPAAGAPRDAAPQPIDRAFTEAELSALLTYGPAEQLPVRSAQVRIHADGQVETAMGLVTSRLPAELLEHLPKALPEQLPLYLKARLAVASSGEIQLEVERVELGRMPMPSSLFAPDGGFSLTDLINEELQDIPGFQLQGLTFAEGAVRIQGTYLP